MGKIFYSSRTILSYLLSLLPLKKKQEQVWRFFSKCISNAENYSLNYNGEAHILKTYSKNRGNKKTVVYDIGANYGCWSEIVLKNISNPLVYAFEIVPQFSEICRKKLAESDVVTVFNIGLSDSNGQVNVHVAGGGASITQPAHNKNIENIITPVVIGDDYVESQQLELPDFIKIDVEGHEKKVLSGLKRTIMKSRPIIQFEYGQYYMNEKTYLKEVYIFLNNLEYDIFQIFPTKIVERHYTPALENFWTVNYIAIPMEKYGKIM